MPDAKPLEGRSLHQIRAIAQAMGVTDIFEKDSIHLVQEIRTKQEALPQPKTPPIPRPPYDARLMTKPPSRRSNTRDIVELLKPYIERGLKLNFDDNGERWMMSCGKKTDEGTVRMPLRIVLTCAENVMR